MSPEIVKYMAAGMGCIVLISVIYLLLIIHHYEKQLKDRDKTINLLRGDLKSAHAKMMTVDYEKLAELDMRVRGQVAEAQIRTMMVTDEWGPVVQTPREVKVPYGGEELHTEGLTEEGS